MDNFKLELPFRDIDVTQPFGVNYVNFYEKLGLKGHNGIDFRARRGCPVRATHDGIITFAGDDGTGGICVEIVTGYKGDGYKTIYYHLKEVKVKWGDLVKTGDIIATADNTGQMTTGDHLHFGLKKVFNNRTIDKDNGYQGGIDPAPYFQYKDWWRSRAYHRYDREQVWIAEWKMRFKNTWLHRRRILQGKNPVPDTEETNAYVYGGWGVEDTENIAMLHNWRYLKKSEYLNGDRPFIK